MPSSDERNSQFTGELRQCHRQLFGYIFALLRNLEDTQDVFQQTCVILWNQFDQYQPGTNFTAWACKVAQFKVRDFLKSRRRYEAHLSEAFALRLAELQAHSSPERLDARQEALAGCIEKLSPHQRGVLQRCYGGTEGVGAVATELGRPIRSLHNSLRRIREQLLNCINRTLGRTTES
jgi:RNA polymerase sigma-70 factor, ECF subfamily